MHLLLLRLLYCCFMGCWRTCRLVVEIHFRLLAISSGVSPKRCGCSAALFTALSSSLTCKVAKHRAAAAGG
jgi:hypothetical protein